MPAVRALAPDEAQLLRELRLRALTDSPDAFAATAEEERQRTALEWATRARDAAGDGDVVIYLAVDEQAPLGMAGASWFDRDRGIVQLWGMWVDPSCRGAGLGTRLVAAVREWSRAHGARFVRLGVIEGPREPTAFYERLGFVRTGEERPLARDAARLAFWMVRPA